MPLDGSAPIPGTNLAGVGYSRSDQVPGTLRFSLDPGAPAGASINPTNGVFTWTPSEKQGPGTYQITARVTDNGSPPLSHTQTFRVTVNEVNTAPRLAGISNLTAYVGETVHFTATASDADLPANTLSFSLTSGPLGASIDPTTGLFSLDPSAMGTFDFTAHVTDNGSPALSDERSFAITAVAPLRISSIVQEGDRVRLTFAAIAGRTYRLQFKTRLEETPWIDSGLTVTASSTATTR